MWLCAVVFPEVRVAAERLEAAALLPLRPMFEAAALEPLRPMLEAAALLPLRPMLLFEPSTSALA